MAPEKLLWPGGKIPFICSSDEVFYSISPHMDQWNTLAGHLVELVVRDEEENYVLFTDGVANESEEIGMAGGAQEIMITETLSRRIVLHEIGHAAGLIHEHCRSDRDRYIRIVDNIPGDIEGLFRKEGSPGIWRPYYDFDSVMHYPPRLPPTYVDVFTLKKEGKKHYKDRTGLEEPGFDLQTLSQGDIENLQRLYPKPNKTIVG